MRKKESIFFPRAPPLQLSIVYYYSFTRLLLTSPSSSPSSPSSSSGLFCSCCGKTTRKKMLKTFPRVKNQQQVPTILFRRINRIKIILSYYRVCITFFSCVYDLWKFGYFFSYNIITTIITEGIGYARGRIQFTCLDT